MLRQLDFGLPKLGVHLADVHGDVLPTARAQRFDTSGSPHPLSTTSVPPIPTDFVRRIRTPGYLVAALLAIVTAGEICVAAWPLRLHEIGWRLAIAGAASSAAGTALLAIVLALMIAVAWGDLAVIGLVSTTCGIAALVWIAGGGLFVLDALQVKSQVKPELLSRYDIALVWSLTKILLAAVVFVSVAISSFRSAVALARSTSAGRKPTEVVVGRPSGPETTSRTTSSVSSQA